MRTRVEKHTTTYTEVTIETDEIEVILRKHLGFDHHTTINWHVSEGFVDRVVITHQEEVRG